MRSPSCVDSRMFPPDFHVMGFVANFVTNLHCGCRAFLLADPDATLSAPLMLRACRDLKPDVLNTVPWVRAQAQC